MKITKSDLQSLRFSVMVLDELAGQTINEAKRQTIYRHKHRIRKVHNMLLLNVSQQTFELVTLCQQGIPDNSQIAQGIQALCPKVTDEVD